MSATKTITSKPRADAKPALPPAVPASDTSVSRAAAAQAVPYAQEGSLCQTCRHQPACLFVKAARRPIVFCDEFSSPLPGENGANPQLETLAQAHSAGQAEDLGICVNCDVRLTCNHRSSLSPVHECEDYQ